LIKGLDINLFQGMLKHFLQLFHNFIARN